MTDPLCRSFPKLGIYRFDETGSTNTEAKRLLSSGAEAPLLVTARMQTAGRGRLGRSFFSPRDAGLYFSLGFRPKGTGTADIVSVTQAAAVALLRAVRPFSGKDVRIKWVNDLYLDGKKIAGILTEAVTGLSGRIEGAVIGIGLNLADAGFPEELRGIAGTLGADAAARDELLEAILCELLPMTENLSDREWMADYRRYGLVPGKRITVLRGGKGIPADALTVTDSGALLVRYDDGTEEALFSGEISVRFADGAV